MILKIQNKESKLPIEVFNRMLQNYLKPAKIVTNDSGKYIGSKDLDQTIYTVNKEATIEIAKQLRLRDIGGIIIIDYIDMENQETKQKILKVLEESVKKDRSKIQIVGFTPLDLLEMTRKHICSND